MSLSEEKKALLAEVAALYYEENLTQAEIASRLNISRSQISRLLTEGRREGVIKVIIDYPKGKNYYDLKRELLQHFDLKEAVLLTINQLEYDRLVEKLGELTAEHLKEKIQAGMIVGTAWNRGLYHVVNALENFPQKDITTVQLTGMVGTEAPYMDAPDLTRSLGQILGAHYKYLPAPLVVEDAATQQLLLQDGSIQKSLALMKQMDIALVGIGTVIPELSSLLTAGYITQAELNDIIQQGGVGDMCGYHFDIKGNLLPLELHQRLIGVNLETLRQTPYVIGVSGSVYKAKAILGALRLNILDCLVTDTETAHVVLKMAQD